ncbi:putative multidrug resistance ABC transporter ATP-binding/permease protein YheH [Corynebacterium occultum]|uniref:Putative multidrug resistance ABC transporter ATP-binding/permease protein YheH n=1 Tax=Corynebacterium occultum TaxID=2675219 RepID=A0A6B8VNC5_9CORY|nr:ABC transporter ATP-binding protein [Corynebacterium occultum]QGU07022.1 putative multidrug resistance ABC transporter ATP-binding/permease protein YheH [Corynebacterium occultum]
MNKGLKQLGQALQRKRAITLLALLTTLGVVAFELAIPLLTRDAVDVAVGDSDGGLAATLLPELAPLSAIITVLAIVALARFVAQFGRRFTAGKLSIDIQHLLRMDVLDSLQSLDGPAQDRLSTGQVVSRSISDLGQVQRLLAMLPLAVGSLAKLVFIVIIMATISPWLTLMALAFLPVIGVVAARARGQLYAASWDAQQSASDLATHVEQNVAGVRVVKAFAQEERETDTLEEHSRSLYARRMRSARLNARFQPLLEELPQIAMVVNVILGGWLAIQGQITVGTFFAFSIYLTQLTAITRMLSGMVVRFQIGLASVDRIAELIEAEPSHHEPDHPTAIPEGPLGLRLEKVEFTTPERRVIQGLDLEVAPGETLGVVGPAGSGKSLAVQLIGGFHEPDAGRILLTSAVGSVDYEEITRDELRRALICVFDEPFLYSTSIRDNIAMGAQVSDEEVVAAARLACAAEFIDELEEGYDTVIGERGLTLSGGQRQRIALARALLVRPRILILDDATSAIDARTEALINANLRRTLADVTVIAIAHRSSTLRLADRVMVLEEGRAVAAGTLAEVEDNPRFARLFDPATRTTSQAPERDLFPEVEWVDPDAPTGQLAKRIDALPGATEQPHLDAARVRSDTSPFRVGVLFKRVKWLLAGVVVLLALGVATGLAFPTLMRLAVDRGVNEQDAGALWVVAGVGLMVVAVGWVSAWLRTLLTARTGERLLFGLRLRSFAHLQRLSMSYYESTMSGRILTRMTTDIDNLSSFLQTGLAEAIVALATLAGIIAMLLYTDAPLALVAFAAIPVILVATLIFRRISSRLYRRAREQVSQVNSSFAEAINGLRTSQMHNMTAVTRDRLETESGEYRRLRVRSQTAVSIYFPGIGAVSELAQAAVLGVGALHVARGEISTGVLIAFVMYLSQLFGPLQQLGQIFDSYQQASVGLQRIQELLAEEPAVADDGTTPGADRAAGKEIGFENVSFAYTEGGTEVARELNTRLAPGSTVALVGPTGAGKSTVVKLLSRFYDPQEGSVTAGGTDLRGFPLQQWRAAIGSVPQESHLFPGTVAENIAYGRPGASREEIIAAVRRVGALEALSLLPDALNHRVGERGQGLSSGQRQLIALARAELIEPRLLLLDEATATLDPATEATVLDASAAVTRGRTSVIVAHRLATAARADRILVIDHGRIIEDGSHLTLLSYGGMYAAMWNSQ